MLGARRELFPSADQGLTALDDTVRRACQRRVHGVVRVRVRPHTVRRDVAGLGCTTDVPVSFNRTLEKHALRNEEKIEQAVCKVPE